MLTNDQAKLVIDAAERACAAANARGARLSKSDIADISQDVFIKVAESWSADRGDLAGFAYIVARNASVDGMRKRTRTGETSLDAEHGDDDSTTLHSMLPSRVLNPRDALIAKRRAESARAAVANLSESAQDALDAAADDATMSGAQRVAKMRAIDALQEVLVA